jgi:3-hydroxybutyrate dehydrogenase
MTKPDEIAAMMREAEARFGAVDVLVNNAGIQFVASIEEFPPEKWDQIIAINLSSAFHTMRAAIPGMKARGWGRIINFSSVEGIRSMPRAAPYTAFKGAIDSFTKSLGVEVAGDGVRVNCIAVDKTRSFQVNFYEQPEEYDRHIPVWVPAGHLADADEVAAVVLFLASELSGWVVGQTIPADGGTLAAGGWYRTPERWTNAPLLHQYYAPDDDRPPTFR